MNYYARIHELLTADQIIVESIEEQQRIDELLGRIGRAMGAMFSNRPANSYTGQWNPLRGKYEGGRTGDAGRAAMKADFKSRRDARYAAASPEEKARMDKTAARDKALADRLRGKPAPAPAPAPVPAPAPAPVPTIDKKTQAQQDMARATEIANKRQARTNRDIGLGADLSQIGKQKGGTKALRQAQSQEGAGRFAAMSKELISKGGTRLSGAARDARVATLRNRLQAASPYKGAPLPLGNSTLYGNVAKLIRESLNEGKLCPRGKAAAKSKFKVYPSAYANMYASAVCSGKVTPKK